MKKANGWGYNSPEVTVVKLHSQDVITASNQDNWVKDISIWPDKLLSIDVEEE